MNESINQVEKTAELLKLLGDKTRLTIFSLLKIKELCVCELTALLDVSQPAISQHLRKLKLLNLVNERKKGQWVYYSLRAPHKDDKMLMAIIEQLPDLTHIINSLDSEETSCKIQDIKNESYFTNDLTLK